ncbi:MAG: NmrA family NAD(P)-binding protein [Myxococcota bacterium]|nr:NmrA family NAD(P)-binding protein [Myxococcota bacterium]
MILVTAAAGNVGREVARALRARGADVRAADRATIDFRDPSTWDAALDGCRAVFLLRPPAISDVEHTLNAFVDRARARGVESFVFLSVAGAETNTFVPHHAVERRLIEGPRDWTILRPGFFAQNFEDAYLRDVREDDRIYVPAGKRRVAFVDVRDLAEVAAAALLEPAAHRGQAYTLTGGEAVSFDTAAALLSRALGRTIRYEPASIVGYALHLRRRGLPRGQIAVQTILHVLLRLGQAESIDPTLGALLGRPPRTLAEYFRDAASAFRSETSV